MGHLGHLRLFFRKADSFFEKVINIKTIYIILFLILVSAVPRAMLFSGLLHHDSVEAAIATENTIETGKLHSVTGYRYGYTIINSLAYLVPHFVFGAKSAETTVAIVTILFASLSVAVFYLFTKELLDDAYIALSSSLLFSFVPVYLAVTTYVKSHAHSVLFILLSGYFMLRLIKTDSTTYKALFSITLGFSLFVRLSDVIVSLPLFGLLYFFSEKFLSKEDIKFNKRLNAVNFLAIFLPLLLAAALFLIFQGRYLLSGATANRFLNPNWSLVFNIAVAIFFFLSLLAVFLVAYGLWCLIRQKKNVAFLLLAWFFSTFIFYSSFWTTKLRFFVLLFIPLSILMAVGLSSLRKKSYTISISVLITTLAWMFLTALPSLSYRHAFQSEKESAIFISGITEENAVIFDAGDSGIFYDYYTNKSIINCLYMDKQKEFEEKVTLIDKAPGNGIPVYMSSQCFSLAKGEDSRFYELWDFFNSHYEWAEVGKVQKENPEAVITLEPKEYIIYKLRKKQN